MPISIQPYCLHWCHRFPVGWQFEPSSFIFTDMSKPSVWHHWLWLTLCPSDVLIPNSIQSVHSPKNTLIPTTCSISLRKHTQSKSTSCRLSLYNNFKFVCVAPHKGLSATAPWVWLYRLKAKLHSFCRVCDCVRVQLQRLIRVDYQGLTWLCALWPGDCVGPCFLALVAVVFHRDANHQACAQGMIKCHPAPLALAIIVNKSSSPTGCETVCSHGLCCVIRAEPQCRLQAICEKKLRLALFCRHYRQWISC